jgi:hypothetical protein
MPNSGGQPYVYEPHPYQQQHPSIPYPQTVHFLPGQIGSGYPIPPVIQQPSVPELPQPSSKYHNYCTNKVNHSIWLSAECQQDSDNQFEWPEGLIQRKEVHNQETKDWAFSSWVWHSNGNVDQAESIYLQLGKAEI